jgi:hypothetical protein
VIEALRYSAGYHAADPGLRICLALNGRSPIELAGLVPDVDETYPIGPPFDFVEGGANNVPFHSVLPDPERFPCYTLMEGVTRRWWTTATVKGRAARACAPTGSTTTWTSSSRRPGS